MPTTYYHNHKILFIAVPKTGSTSVSETLKKIKGKKTRPKKKNKHSNIEVFCNEANIVLPEETYAFCFVRNPYDWAYSMYAFVHNKDIKSLSFKIKKVDFETWLIKTVVKKTNDKRITGKAQMYPQSWYTKEFNEIKPNIFRFENFNKDFTFILNKFNIKTEIISKNINPERLTDYREAYNATTRSIIEEYYAEDLERFGYTYDTH